MIHTLSIKYGVSDPTGDTDLFVPKGALVELIKIEDDMLLVEYVQAHFSNPKSWTFHVAARDVRFACRPLTLIHYGLNAALELNDWDYVKEIEEFASVTDKLFDMGVEYENK